MTTLWAIYIGWALLISTGLVIRLFSGPRCLHDWQLVDKMELPPPRYDAGNMTYYTSDIKWLTTRKIVLVTRCTKCGACKVIRESNP